MAFNVQALWIVKNVLSYMWLYIFNNKDQYLLKAYYV